jgi:tetratricopeptide (TPR) repeat protein
MARDWDLFSPAAFGITLLAILLIKDRYLASLKRLIISILVLLFIYPLPFFMTALQEMPSIDYAFYMIRLDLPKSFSTIFVLNKYLEGHGYVIRADLLQKIYNKHPFMKGRSDLAMELIGKGDLQGAWRIVHSSIKDRFDQNYQTVLKELYLKEGNYKKALEHANKAIQLQAYADYLYAYRGEILVLMGRFADAMKDFRKGYELNKGNPTHLEGIASVFFLKNQYDSGIVYTERMIQVDSTKPIAYFMLARAHAMEGRIDKAKLYANRYAEFVAEDSSLTRHLSQLLGLIKRQESKSNKNN